jgi:hypothetical protein
LKLILDESNELFHLDQSKENVERFWYLKFWRRPKHINGKTIVESVDFKHMQPVANSDYSDEHLSVQENGNIETIPCGLVIKSIGYSGIQVRMTSTMNIHSFFKCID